MWADDYVGLQIQGELATRQNTNEHETQVRLLFQPFVPVTQAPVTMEGGKISVQFPQYLFTAEMIEDKLVMVREELPPHWDIRMCRKND